MDQQKQPDNGSGKVRFKRMMTTAAVVIFTACCIILFYFSVERYEGLGEGWDTFVGVWQPIIIGIILAFLMNPIMAFFEKRMLPFFMKRCKAPEKAKKTTRMITTLISMVIVIGMIILIFVAIIPVSYTHLTLPTKA